MSDLTPTDTGNITEQLTEYKASVSEYLETQMGHLLNWLRLKMLLTHTFTMNGRAQFFATLTGVDGYFIMPYDGKIIDVILHNQIAGSGGTLEVTLKYSVFPNGAWTNLLTTTPKILYSASSGSSVGVGDTVTGCTAAVLNAASQTLAAKTRIRMDCVTAINGSKSAALQIVVKPN